MLVGLHWVPIGGTGQNSAGKWTFALLPGTNRLKTSIDIKEKQIPNAKELKKRFRLLPKGEQVFWLHPDLEDFAFPDPKMTDAIMSSAKKARIKLYVPSVELNRKREEAK